MYLGSDLIIDCRSCSKTTKTPSRVCTHIYSLLDASLSKNPNIRKIS